MFFKAKPTIYDDQIEWQLDCWQWLLENLGGLERLKQNKNLIPSKADFPPSGKSSSKHAEFVFQQVAKVLGVDAKKFKLIQQEATLDAKLDSLALVNNVPTDPLGTYSIPMGSSQEWISYSPDLLKNLEGLIATFVHEICHSILLSIPTKPPGELINENDEFDLIEELATDLAVAFFGFGIFGGNCSFTFSQFSDSATGTQGWSSSKSGYLSQNEWAFALAMKKCITGEDDANILNYSSDGLLEGYKKNLKFLQKNSKIYRHLL